MSYQIIFADTAKEDLLKIAKYIAQQSGNKETAKKFISRLRQECIKLQDFPESGALAKDRLLKNAGYRSITYQKYPLFYRAHPSEQTVIMMAVFSAGQDYFRTMKQYL